MCSSDLTSLDLARGISIVLVVMGHGVLEHHHPALNDFLSNLRMPLLFLLAGMHLNWRTGLPSTVWRKADGLLKPYVVMALLFGGYAALMGRIDSPLDYVHGVFSFDGLQMPGWLYPMWFLTLLWVLHVAAALAQPWLAPQGQARQGRIWAFTLALGLVGVVAMPGHHDWWTPWRCTGPALSTDAHPLNLDLLPLAGMWFLLGHQLQAPLAQQRWSWTSIVCLMVIAICLQLDWQPHLNMLERRMDSPIASMLVGLCASLGVLGLSQRLSRLPLPTFGLMASGRYSLYLLMFHAPLLSLGSKALQTGLGLEIGRAHV